MITSSIALASVVAASALLAASPVQNAAPATKPAASATTAAATYDVDPTHSKALFRVQHLGAGAFWGRFNDVTGTFTGANGSPDGAAFDITVKVDSVDTGTDKLDAHLKSPDFFNAKEHPTLTFKSTSVKKGAKDGWLDVSGDLTMNGVTKPVTAMVEWIGTNEGPMGKRSGYEATLNIKRSDWNINYGVDKNMVGNDVRLVVSLEGVAKK
ncbi:MAG: YceI family protein [Phycisphaerales bacterium]